MPESTRRRANELLIFLCMVCAAMATACGDPASEDNEDLGCRLNSDCQAGFVCEDDACVEAPPACEGDGCPCDTDAACDEDLICQQDTQTCEAPLCRSDLNCALGEVCFRGRCLTDTEADSDRDGVPDLEDNCRLEANAEQDDLDGDGLGNACDDDLDDDGLTNLDDNCPNTSNPDQRDLNGNGRGDACEGEIDGLITVNLTILPDWLPRDDSFVTLQLISGLGGQSDERRASNGESIVFSGLAADTYILVAERQGFGPVRRIIHLNEAQTSQTLDIVVALEDLGASSVDLGGEVVLDSDLNDLPTTRGANLSGATITGGQTGIECEIEADCDEGAGQTCREGQCRRPADLCGIDLSGASLVGANLDRARLESANLTGANLSNASLTRTLLTGIDLSGANLFGANLQGADLSGTSPGCDPDNPDPEPLGSRLVGADFTSANLRNARFVSDAEALNLPQEPCALDGERTAIDLSGVTFSQTNLSGAFMPGVALPGADLSSALLQNTDLRSSCLQNTSFILTNLRGGDLEGADLSDSVMLGAILLEATLRDAIIEGANLSGANLVGANLQGVQANGASMLNVTLGDALRFAPEPPSDCDLLDLPEICADWEDIDTCEQRVCDTLGDCDFRLPRACTVSRTILTEADFSEVEMVGVLFNHADLAHTSFANANLRNTTFVDVSIEGVDFAGANLDTSDMSRLNLSGLNMSRASFQGANLERSDLSETDFTDANLTSANLSLTTAPGAQFERANLAQATLQQISIDGATFRSADITGADFRESTGEDVDFVLARALRTRFERADLRGTSFDGARIEEADFTNAILHNVTITEARSSDFSQAELLQANFAPCLGCENNTFDGADLNRADFSNAIITGASFVGAKVQNVNFTSTILPSAFMERADLSGSNFAGAILEGIFWDNTICPDTTNSDDHDDQTCLGNLGQDTGFECEGDLNEPNDALEEATPITSGVEGRICEGDVDLFRAEITEGAVITISLDMIRLAPSDQVSITLLASDAESVLARSVLFNESQVIRDIVAPFSGTYFIAVQHTQGDALHYNMALFAIDGIPCEGDFNEPNDVFEEATPIERSVEGVVCEGDVDIFLIDMPEGAEATIVLGNLGNPEISRASLTLLASDAQTVLAQGEGLGPEQLIQGFTVPVTDIYFIVVQHIEGEAMPYVVEAIVSGEPQESCGDDQLEPPTPNAVQIVQPGVYDNLALCDEDTVDLFAFYLEPGDVFSLLIESNNPAMRADFFPFDNQEDRISSDPELFPIELEAQIEVEGLYILAVNNLDAQPTLYTLDVSIEGPPDCGEDELEEFSRQQDTLEPAFFVELALCEEDPVDTFRISLEEGSEVTTTIHFLHTDADLSLELVNSRFETLAISQSDEDTESITFFIEEPGSHFLRVINETGTPVNYDLEVDFDRQP